jgi:hypothetical protein
LLRLICLIKAVPSRQATPPNLRGLLLIYLIFCAAVKKLNCSCKIHMNCHTNFLLEIHWPFWPEGIYIRPTHAIKEIRLNINQSLEKRHSNPVKILKSGMLVLNFL